MGRVRHKIVKGFDQRRGQSTLEFTFAMIVIIFLIYGMVRVFGWVGKEAAGRRVAHDLLLTDPNLTPEQQLNPDFYRAGHMGAVFTGNIVR